MLRRALVVGTLPKGLVLQFDSDTYNVLLVLLFEEPFSLYLSENFSPLSFVKCLKTAVLNS